MRAPLTTRVNENSNSPATCIMRGPLNGFCMLCACYAPVVALMPCCFHDHSVLFELAFTPPFSRIMPSQHKKNILLQDSSAYNRLPPLWA